MKQILLLVFTLTLVLVKAQKIDNIFINLYTDSLKKGSFNYINIDGQLSNGKYLPLDSTQLIFWSSAGKFNGNSLWIEKEIIADKVDIRVTLKKKPSLYKEFSLYIKKNPDPELKTLEELMIESKSKSKSKSKNNKN